MGQPIANWARRTEVGSDKQNGVSEVVGETYSRLLGHCGVIAQRDWVCELLLDYRQPCCETSTPSSFPQIAFFINCSRFCIAHPPPTEEHQAPSLPLGEISVVTISPGKGSDNLTKASARGIWVPRSSCCISLLSFGVALSLLFGFSLILFLVFLISLFLSVGKLVVIMPVRLLRLVRVPPR